MLYLLKRVFKCFNKVNYMAIHPTDLQTKNRSHENSASSGGFKKFLYTYLFLSFMALPFGIQGKAKMPLSLRVFAIVNGSIALLGLKYEGLSKLLKLPPLTDVGYSLGKAVKLLK